MASPPRAFSAAAAAVEIGAVNPEMMLHALLARSNNWSA